MDAREEAIEALARFFFDLTKLTWFQAQREKLKGGYDLSESEFLALDALDKGGTLSVGELRRHVGVLPAQMSRTIKALEQRYDEKLVLCSINADDKRKIDVSITPRGHKALEAYVRSKISSTIRALRTLEDREVREQMRLLEKVHDAVEEDQAAE